MKFFILSSFLFFRAPWSQDPSTDEAFANGAPTPLPSSLGPPQARQADTTPEDTHGGQAIAPQCQTQHLRRRIQHSGHPEERDVCLQGEERLNGPVLALCPGFRLQRLRELRGERVNLRNFWRAHVFDVKSIWITWSLIRHPKVLQVILIGWKFNTLATWRQEIFIFRVNWHLTASLDVYGPLRWAHRFVTGDPCNIEERRAWVQSCRRWEVCSCGHSIACLSIALSDSFSTKHQSLYSMHYFKVELLYFLWKEPLSLQVRGRHTLCGVSQASGILWEYLFVFIEISPCPALQ